MKENDVDMRKVNRLEVIDEDGRSYVNWQDTALGIEMSLQDEGRTIKIFTKGSSNVAPAKEEQGDPYRPRFRSAVSGLWYTDDKAAGDIDIVEVGGVKFFPPGEGDEERAKVLTDEEIERIVNEYADHYGQGRPGRSDGPLVERAEGVGVGLRHARDNGYLAPASGLTVEQVMEALDNVGRHEGWGLVTVAKGALHKALEDLAGKE